MYSTTKRPTYGTLTKLEGIEAILSVELVLYCVVFIAFVMLDAQMQGYTVFL